MDARVHTDDGGITGMVRRRLRTEEVAEEEALVDAFGRDSIVRNNALDRRPPRGAFAGSASPAASASTSTAPPRVSREFRDAAGDPFTVELSNEDAPAGLTKIELRGVDRANLLGALCSSLARANISVVSGVIATDPDGRVRNTMFVRKSPPGDRIGIGARGPVGSVVDGPSSARLDEREFADVSLRILSACWTSAGDEAPTLESLWSVMASGCERLRRLGVRLLACLCSASKETRQFETAATVFSSSASLAASSTNLVHSSTSAW